MSTRTTGGGSTSKLMCCANAAPGSGGFTHSIRPFERLAQARDTHSDHSRRNDPRLAQFPPPVPSFQERVDRVAVTVDLAVDLFVERGQFFQLPGDSRVHGLPPYQPLVIIWLASKLCSRIESTACIKASPYS